MNSQKKAPKFGREMSLLMLFINSIGMMDLSLKNTENTSTFQIVGKFNFKEGSS